MNFLNYITQPFPKAENKWKVIISISIFVSLFLIIFQPFDINLYNDSNKILVLSGYGLVTFFVLIFDMIILENLFRKFYNEQNWKIWKEFVSLIWVIFSIGLGNALYTSIVFGFYFEVGLKFFITFQMITLVVGVIPITVLIITKQKYLLKKHAFFAKELNKNIENIEKSTHENKLIKIFADNQKDFLEIILHDFLYIESSGNYIDINYLKDNKQVRKTLRNTIKQVVNFFNDSPEILQCHRAFIVNTTKITNAKGNSQGLRLHLEDCDEDIPVSRSKVDSVKKMIS